jgi:hypothetical protein
MSSDAALWVVEQLRGAEAHPQAAGMVPAISYVLNSTAGDGKGGILEHISYPHFRIGWYRPEQVSADDGTWVEVLDRKVFLHNSTLKELRGKHLRLQTVKSALASQLGTTRYVLRAGAEEKGIFKFLDD